MAARGGGFADKGRGGRGPRLSAAQSSLLVLGRREGWGFVDWRLAPIRLLARRARESKAAWVEVEMGVRNTAG